MAENESNETSDDKLVSELEGKSDDELALLAANDEVLELDETYGVFKQEDGLVAWSIHNLYREDGKLRPKGELKRDPAILRIEGSEGESVDFSLTKEFVGSMREALETVNLASHGITKKQRTFGSFKEALKSSVLENPIRVLLLGGLFVLTLLFIFIL